MLQTQCRIFDLGFSEWNLFFFAIHLQDSANLNIECGSGLVLVFRVRIEVYVEFNVTICLDLVAEQGGVEDLYIFVVLD